MKTRNAFAFRNFDEQRILSRPYFSEFRADYHVEDGLSDEEILARFSTADADSLETTQGKIAAIDDLLLRGTDYQKRILRHSEKIAKYVQLLERKIATDETVDIDQMRARHRRARELSAKYSGYMYQFGGESAMRRIGISAGGVGSLLEKISKKYTALDEKRRWYYRKGFAARLRQARRAKGLTQTKFAAKLHMSQTGYMQYETARRDPSLPTLIEIAKKINQSTDWLLGLTP